MLQGKYLGVRVTSWNLSFHFASSTLVFESEEEAQECFRLSIDLRCFLATVDLRLVTVSKIVYRKMPSSYYFNFVVCLFY